MIGYIIVLVIGLVISVKFGRDLMLGQKSRSWPTTAGTILHSGMEIHRETDKDGSTSTTYGVTLQYAYSVSGQEFQGTRRTFANVRTGSRRRTESILLRYPQGGSVAVYYNPEDPSSSVLEPGVTWVNYLLLAFAIILLLVGIAGVVGLFG
jgi:hypothetical protein